MGEADADGPAPVPSVITRSAEGAAADLLDNLDHLSDEEVEMLLKQASGDNVRN